MASLSTLNNTWNTLKEIDLRPLRETAIQGVNLAVVGAPGSGRRALIDEMRRDPVHPHLESDTPVMLLDIASPALAQGADLIILMIAATNPDVSREKEAALAWTNSGKKVLVFVDYSAVPSDQAALASSRQPTKRQVIHGSVHDTRFLQHEFASAVINALPNSWIPLGRGFPLFRQPIAQRMINDTCFTNGAFVLSTGLAGIIAILDIPLLITDSVMLTKNQMLLVYKLGLMLGFSTEWQDYVKEFGGVLGAGFFWRQLARSLVGLIPLWGIIPKVAVAYSGTYVVGHTVLQWYLTGRHITRSQMQQLYARAYQKGKESAQRLRQKVRRSPRQVEAGKPKPALPARSKPGKCPNCGKRNASDALFCQYCGKSLQENASQST